MQQRVYFLASRLDGVRGVLCGTVHDLAALALEGRLLLVDESTQPPACVRTGSRCQQQACRKAGSRGADSDGGVGKRLSSRAHICLLRCEDRGTRREVCGRTETLACDRTMRVLGR